MADLIGKVEGIAGLALIGGLAYGALRFGPELIRGFRDAMTGLRDSFAGMAGAVGDAAKTAVDAVGDAAKTAVDAVGDTIDIVTPNNPLDSARDTIDIITTPGADPGAIGAIGDSALKTLFDLFGIINPALGKGGNLLVDTVPPSKVANLVVDTLGLGLGGGAAPGQTISPFVAASASAANVVQQINDAAAAAAAQVTDAGMAAIKGMEDSSKKLLAAPSKEVADFAAAGKDYGAAGVVSSGSSGKGVTTVYGSGAYTTTQKGQIVSAGSAGSYGQPISAKEAAARAKLGIK